MFDIKEFSVFDGPGIRTTVFLKGCALRCAWCHNPEGLSAAPELMVSRAACAVCGACVRACPRADSATRTFTPAWVHPDCAACGACVPACRLDLRRIVGRNWRADELAARLLRGAEAFELSGGGVTFSGGEPLLQWDFAARVIERLGGVHVAVETSGYAPDAVFRAMAERVDLVLLDIKHFDPAAHKRCTGADSAPILRHLDLLARGETPFIVRMPIIPGVNDVPEHFRFVAERVNGARALQRVELLPYQRTAGAKYAMVNRVYAPDFDETAAPRMFPEAFSESGIPFKILPA